MANSRDALTSRTLPSMTFSDGLNPLTAPVLLDPSLPPLIKAAKRFSVEGQNAVGEQNKYSHLRCRDVTAGDTFLVTGGAGRLGLEAALTLLEHGLLGVCLFDVSPSITSSEPAIKALRHDFPESKIVTEIVDVTDDQAVQSAVERTVQNLGSVDILLCFAGVVGCTHAAEMTSSEWKRVLDINTTGSWFCAQAIGRYAPTEPSIKKSTHKISWQTNDPTRPGRKYRFHRLNLCSSRELPATTSRIQRLQRSDPTAQKFTGSRVGAIWNPGEQYKPRVHGYHPQRRRGTRERPANMDGEEPDGEDRASERAGGCGDFTL
jgi:short chain dehydrogenase